MGKDRPPLEKSGGAVLFRMRKSSRRGSAEGKIAREYLLLHYEAGHWDFPKGHLEGGESPEDAARREIREETGLSIRRFVPGFKRHIRYWMWKYPETPGARARRSLKIVTFFLAEISSDREVRLSHEHTGYVWVSFRDSIKLVTYDNAKDILRRAEAFLRNPSR